MLKPAFMEGFAEAIIGVQAQGTLSVPDPDNAEVVRFLRLDFTGPRAWPYIYFHFSHDDHIFISLN